MKTYHQKTFTTGEFAKLLDINKDTLLYYDKIDLFKPAGIHSNGYRYYTFEQFDQFMAIHSLRQVELPIKELKTYFEAPTIHSLQQLAMKKSKQLALELKKLQDIQFFLQRVVELTNEMKDIPFGEVLFKQLPEESIVYSEEKLDWSLSIEDLYQRSSQFLKELGVKSTAAHGTVYAKEQLFQEEDDLHHLFCHVDTSNAKKKPAGLYAIIYHKGPFDFIDDTYTQLINSLATQNLEMDGDVYEEYLLHSIAALEEEEFVTKISVKVKQTVTA
ncbi:MerR family transcriptional regulator [Psychrobacillus sp. FSL W7-1457]|uniref:MerR family transcriptional regulator n=1 Tax=Psychrobacillus sp. FSL W7-1457 TaxID=2954547 RepID=UPI00315A7D84